MKTKEIVDECGSGELPQVEVAQENLLQSNVGSTAT